MNHCPETVSINGMLSFAQSDKNFFNTLTSGLIQAVHKKQLIRTWLCAGISPLLYRLRTWSKCQKMQQVL